MSQYILAKGPARLGVLGHLSRQLQALSQDCEWVVTVEEMTSAKRRRTEAQNGIQHVWHMEAATQLRDGTAEDYRAYCKLHFGVPILRAEDAEFRAQYDSIVRPLPYEQKLALMKAPIDFPTTRLMTVKQKSAYLDAICQHYMGLGVRLTIPEDQWTSQS